MMTVLNNKVTIGSGRPVPAGPGTPLGWAAQSTLCADRPGASLRGMSVPPASSTPAELSSGLVPSCMENCNITVSYRTGGWVPSLPQSTAVTPPEWSAVPSIELMRTVTAWPPPPAPQAQDPTRAQEYALFHFLPATCSLPGAGKHQGGSSVRYRLWVSLSPPSGAP